MAAQTATRENTSADQDATRRTRKAAQRRHAQAAAASKKTHKATTASAAPTKRTKTNTIKAYQPLAEQLAPIAKAQKDQNTRYRQADKAAEYPGFKSLKSDSFARTVAAETIFQFVTVTPGEDQTRTFAAVKAAESKLTNGRGFQTNLERKLAKHGEKVAREALTWADTELFSKKKPVNA